MEDEGLDESFANPEARLPLTRVTAVPEPSTTLLLAAGLALMAAGVRRRRG